MGKAFVFFNTMKAYKNILVFFYYKAFSFCFYSAFSCDASYKGYCFFLIACFFFIIANMAIAVVCKYFKSALNIWCKADLLYRISCIKRFAVIHK